MRVERRRSRPCIVVASRDAMFADRVAHELADEYIVLRADQNAELADEAARVRPAIMLIDLDDETQTIPAITAVRQQSLNGFPSILVRQRAGDVGAVVRAMRAGADEFILGESGPDEVRLRCGWLLHRKDRRRGGESAQEPLEVRTFGTFILRRGNTIVIDGSWPNVKARTLLQYLFTHRGRRVPKSELIELLWPEIDPSVGANRLKQVLLTVRRAVDGEDSDGESIIRHESGAFRFNVFQAYGSDVDYFQSSLRLARDLERLGELDKAFDEYRSALAVYRGDYLAEDPYEDWVIEEREQLRDNYLNALEAISDLALRCGRYADAIEYARVAARVEPLRESVYIPLFYGLAAVGRRSDAMQTYAELAQLLDDELGVAPQPDTHAAYRAVRDLGADAVINRGALAMAAAGD